MPKPPQPRASRSGRSLLVLFSVLALMAFGGGAFVPNALAEIEYNDSPEELPEQSKIPTKPGKEVNPGKAEKSDDGGESSPGGSDGTETSEPETEEGAGGGNGPGKDKGDDGGKKAGLDGGKKGLGEAKAVTTPSEGKNVAETNPTVGDDDDGGSSPLVPILIVLAVLAAIAVGFVVYRQKRDDDGSGSSLSSRAG